MVKVKDKSSVHFHFQDLAPNLKARRKLKDFLTFLFKNEKKNLAELNYIFCTDKFLLKINKQYLKHDYYTDIISFDLSDSPKEIVGEIYISLPRVKQNARFFKQRFSNELLRVMFHGALHLCGYEDETIQQQAQMKTKEEYYLGRYSSLVPRRTVS
jgi:rRNA maturation RNase YbeY